MRAESACPDGFEWGCRVGRLGVGGGVCAPCWWGNGLVVVSAGARGLRNWLTVARGRGLGWVNCSAGSVCWWCEWDANWVVVRSRGDTVVARADLR